MSRAEDVARGTARWGALALTIAVASACRGRAAPSRATEGAASASAASSASIVEAPPSGTPRAQRPPVGLRFASSDGTVELAATLHPGAAESGLVVLVHHLGGDGAEWDPLIPRIVARPGAPSVLVVDLRGHGASTFRPGADGGARAVVWSTMPPAAWRATTDDVRRAIAEARRVLRRRVPSVAIAGSDVGASIAAEVAAAEPDVTSLALVSPVAATRGIDLYRAFAPVRERPVLVVAAAGDPVSGDPAESLARMATRATVRRFDGDGHGADRIAITHPEVWDALATWLTGAGTPP